MLGRILKWIGIVLGVIVLLIVIAVAAVYAMSESRFNATHPVQVETITIPSDPAAIAHGEHLARSIADCSGCHYENFAGGEFINNPAFGQLYSANLTKGKGGIGATFSDTDWVRVLRHGVRPDGKSVVFMPSQELGQFSDEDLGAIIAYVKSLPPVDNELPPNSAGPLARVLFLQGQLPLLPAELIDHNASHPAKVAAGKTAEYGKYLSVACVGCHNPSLSGGQITGAPPDAPPAANLTPAGDLAAWSEQDFVSTMRTGKTPSGQELNPFMPWMSLGKMTDDELGALYLYIKSLPPKPTGVR